MYSDEDPFAIAQKHLKNLPSKNMLKPKMCAKHRRRPLYGVSVGVHCFVRPLYLYKKLFALKNVENGEPIRLEDVDAYKIEGTNPNPNRNSNPNPNPEPTLRPPCVPCECFFNAFEGKCKFDIGNCAEYDVIGNVDPNLLKTEEGKYFVNSCKRHLTAFNEMNAQEITDEISKQNFEIIKEYFCKTHGPPPLKPSVLNYKWDAVGKRFDLIVMAWPTKEPIPRADVRGEGAEGAAAAPV